MHLQTVCLQPFNGNVISWVQSLQPTLQLGLWAAVDNTWHRLAFAPRADVGCCKAPLLSTDAQWPWLVRKWFRSALLLLPGEDMWGECIVWPDVRWHRQCHLRREPGAWQTAGDACLRGRRQRWFRRRAWSDCLTLSHICCESLSEAIVSVCYSDHWKGSFLCWIISECSLSEEQIQPEVTLEDKTG